MVQCSGQSGEIICLNHRPAKSSSFFMISSAPPSPTPPMCMRGTFFGEFPKSPWFPSGTRISETLQITFENTDCPTSQCYLPSFFSFTFILTLGFQLRGHRGSKQNKKGIIDVRFRTLGRLYPWSSAWSDFRCTYLVVLWWRLGDRYGEGPQFYALDLSVGEFGVRSNFSTHCVWEEPPITNGFLMLRIPKFKALCVPICGLPVFL